MSKRLICTMDGVHGKFWRVGDTATSETLESLGGFVPDYFKPMDSPEGLEADADNNGTVTVKEIKAFLMAKGVQFSPSAKKAELEALMTKVAEDEAEAAKNPPAPGVIGDGGGTSAPGEGNPLD